MSADTSGAVHDQVARDGRQEPTERAGGQQASRAEAPRQPTETRSRAEYNTARHAEPPIRRQSDPGQSVQADRQPPGGTADRRAEQATTGGAADASTRNVRQTAEALTRTEYNTARHAALPIEQPAQLSRLSVAEADRTVGDTTPTGIGLKPTGEQLRDMESDNPSRSRLDRMLDRALDRADDIHDSAGETAEAITAFRHPDPALSAHQAYAGHVTHDHPQPQGPPVNDMVGSTVVVAVAALAGLRHWIEHGRKEHEP